MRPNERGATISDSSNSSEPTVLLVEDSIDDVILTRRAFKKAGIESLLRVCADGEQALDYLAGQVHSPNRVRYPYPELVLLDWKLPRRNGLEVLRWIRQQPQFERLAVVIVSASGQQDERDSALTAGANAYVQKPLGLQPLLDLLDTLHLDVLTARVRAARSTP